MSESRMGLWPVDTVSNYAAYQSVYSASLLVFCSSSPHNSGREIMGKVIYSCDAYLRLSGGFICQTPLWYVYAA
jgi:hypothetical protein